MWREILKKVHKQDLLYSRYIVFNTLKLIWSEVGLGLAMWPIGLLFNFFLWFPFIYQTIGTNIC